MALVYFDASALVKLVVEEDGTDVATLLWNGCDAALSSRLAYAEVRAALAAAVRNRYFGAGDYRVAVDEWEQLWSAARPVELTEAVAAHAGALAERHALRGTDAVHLSSALAIGGADLVVAVWDRRLHAGVKAEGLRPAPATLDT